MCRLCVRVLAFGAQPWLIEVNSSPACDYSTEVTKEYVQAALQDAIKVVLDRREWEALPKKDRGAEPDTGGWELIYKGPFLETPIASFGAEMSLRGSSIELPKPVRPAPPVPSFKRRSGSFKQAAAAQPSAEDARASQVAAADSGQQLQQAAAAPTRHVKPATLHLETLSPSQPPKSPQAPVTRVAIANVRVESEAPPSSLPLPSAVAAPASAVKPDPGSASPLDGMVLMGRSMSIKAKQH